jgi:outer membrane protein OmpA-like peptidoglycan-associated protein
MIFYIRCYKVRFLLIIVCLFYLAACSPKPVPGPDQQFSEALAGAATGAGAGAVTGFQVSAATGPGALVGAGFGAITGAMQGYSKDLTEEQQIALQREINSKRRSAYAQTLLAEHFQRRAELHPTRDIFPADWFFTADEVVLNASGLALLEELTKINKERLPYSRLIVVVYSKATDNTSVYANHLSERRSREIVDALITNGIEPRRLSTKPFVVPNPILIDPKDRPERYNQAVELVAYDR